MVSQKPKGHGQRTNGQRERQANSPSAARYTTPPYPKRGVTAHSGQQQHARPPLPLAANGEKREGHLTPRPNPYSRRIMRVMSCPAVTTTTSGLTLSVTLSCPAAMTTTLAVSTHFDSAVRVRLHSTQLGSAYVARKSLIKGLTQHRQTLSREKAWLLTGESQMAAIRGYVVTVLPFGDQDP